MKTMNRIVTIVAFLAAFCGRGGLIGHTIAGQNSESATLSTAGRSAIQAGIELERQAQSLVNIWIESWVAWIDGCRGVEGNGRSTDRARDRRGASQVDAVLFDGQAGAHGR